MNVECHGERLTQVLAPLDAYVAGMKNADAAALERAFDAPNAAVVFVNDGQASYSAISAAIPKWIAGGPLRDEEISSTLLSLAPLSATLCVATCEMRLKAATYRDTMVIGRVGEVWKIVCKTFVRVEAANVRR